MTILLSSHMLDVVQTVCSPHRPCSAKAGSGSSATVEELNAKLGGAAFVIDVEADGIRSCRLGSDAQRVKAVEPGRCGHWLVEAERDISRSSPG